MGAFLLAEWLRSRRHVAESLRDSVFAPIMATLVKIGTSPQDVFCC